MVFFCWLQYSIYLAHSAYLLVIFGFSVLISAPCAFFCIFILFFSLLYFVNVAFIALSNVFFYILPTVVYSSLKNSQNISAFFFMSTVSSLAWSFHCMHWFSLSGNIIFIFFILYPYFAFPWSLFYLYPLSFLVYSSSILSHLPNSFFLIVLGLLSTF